MRLQIEVSECEDGHRVALAGELDIRDAEAISDLLASLGTTVVVDLDQLSFIDASGISALIRAKQSIEAESNKLVLQGARDRVRDVFELVGLVEYFAL